MTLRIPCLMCMFRPSTTCVPACRSTCMFRSHHAHSVDQPVTFLSIVQSDTHHCPCPCPCHRPCPCPCTRPCPYTHTFRYIPSCPRPHHHPGPTSLVHSALPHQHHTTRIHRVVNPRTPCALMIPTGGLVVTIHRHGVHLPAMEVCFRRRSVGCGWTVFLTKHLSCGLTTRMWLRCTICMYGHRGVVTRWQCTNTYGDVAMHAGGARSVLAAVSNLVVCSDGWCPVDQGLAAMSSWVC